MWKLGSIFVLLDFTFSRLEGQDSRLEPTHRLRRLLVRVLRCKVLQHLLVVAAVDASAVDLQDDLAGLEPCPRRLPACVVSQETQGVRGQRSDTGELRKDDISNLFVPAENWRKSDFVSPASLRRFLHSHLMASRCGSPIDTSAAFFLARLKIPEWASHPARRPSITQRLGYLTTAHTEGPH